MQLGIVGLGRMGSNMALRLLRGGHSCVVFDRDPAPGAALSKEGAALAASLQDLVERLAPPRAVWTMLPAGAVTEGVLRELAGLLTVGDALIDGGNTFHKDDRRRAAELEPLGIHYVDVGASGGAWGLERGFCLMIGGPTDAVRRLEPIFETLAPGQGGTPPTPGAQSTAPKGYLHCGPAGAGHFVKMIHNGIEYGLMQAYAEGFELLRALGSEKALPSERCDLPLGEIAELWRRGSAVSSWLLDLAARALLKDPQLIDFEGRVPDSGEGRGTVQAAVELGVPADALAHSLFRRFSSRQDRSFADQFLSALRNEFGGRRERLG